MPSNLNLRSHATNPAILTSLAWNAIRDVLTTIGHPEFVPYIESVKVSGKRVTIKTGKPIVNNELLHHREVMIARIEESFRKFGDK